MIKFEKYRVMIGFGRKNSWFVYKKITQSIDQPRAKYDVIAGPFQTEFKAKKAMKEFVETIGDEE